MKKLTLLAITMAIAGIFCAATTYFAIFCYNRFSKSETELEQAMADFNNRLAKLERHKTRELTPVQLVGTISTTDLKLSPESWDSSRPSSDTNTLFRTALAKYGKGIFPELRLPFGSVAEYQFEIKLEKEDGIVADAWLSQHDGFQDLANFQEFRVSGQVGTHSIKVFARSQFEASVKLHFSIVVLCEK